MLDQRAMAFTPKPLAEIGGASVLPDDGVVDRLPGLAIPDNRGLTLVGDANGSRVAGLRSGLSKGLERHRNLRRRDLLRIVFDPSGLRKYLIEFPLSYRAHRSLLIEQESPRTGCGLGLS